jgi:general secretion pathway protein L
MRLFIRINAHGDRSGLQDVEARLADVEWLLLDRQGTLVSQGAGDAAMLDRLVDLKTAREPHEVVLLVPTEQCLAIRCNVPGRTVGQMRRALPYAAEEFLAGDIDAMHVAAASLRRNVPVDALLIDRELLRIWLDALASHGVVASVALPDAALLPLADATMTILFADDRVLLRTSDQMIGCEPSTVRLALESWLSTATAESLRVVLVNGDVPEVERAELEQLTERPVEWVHDDTELTPLAYLAQSFDSAPHPVNLLQGEFAPPKAATGDWQRWRGVAALLAVWFAVLLGSDAVTGIWATHRANTVTGDVEKLYRSYFPAEQRIVDPYKQMVAHLGGRTADGPSFLALLGSLAAGLAANPGAELHSITYNQARAELGAEVAVTGFDALETLKSAWAKAGVNVDIASAEQQGQVVNARIRLRAG